MFVRRLWAFALLSVAPVALHAQAVVPSHEEPCQRLVHENLDLRVPDIEIAPGDTTLFHRHDAPIEATGRWFRSAGRRLDRGSAWSWEGHDRPVVAVQVAPGAVSVERETGSALELQDVGHHIVRQPRDRARFRNAGDGPESLSIIEVR